MTVMVEGGAASAAAVGVARLRPRRGRGGRVRREPIDVEQLTAGLADSQPRTELEIIAALEAEVERAHQARALPESTRTEAPRAEMVAVTPAAPVPIFVEPAARREAGHETEPPTAGLPLEQVRAWLEQVKDDLRKVQARVEYLQFEQTRLQGQHHLVAELISSTTAI